MENRLFAFIDFECNAMPALFLHKGPKMTRNESRGFQSITRKPLLFGSGKRNHP